MPQLVLGGNKKSDEFCRRVPRGGVRVRLRSFLYPKSARKVREFLGDPSVGVSCCEGTIFGSMDWFDDIVVTLAIMLNVVILAMYDPTATVDASVRVDGSTPDTTRNDILNIIDAAITIFFVVELGLRCFCFGTRNFFSDVWKCMDFLIVAVSCATVVVLFVPDLEGGLAKGFVLLRAARMLRPFKSMTRFPSVRVLVVALIQSFRSLLDITILFSMFLLVFGVATCAQYQGRLMSRCINDDYYNVTIRAEVLRDNISSIGDFVCGGKYEIAQAIEGSSECDEGRVCDELGDAALLARGYRCPWGYRCVNIGENPLYGYVSFDNSGYAIFTLFVMVTLEGWTDVMYDLMDGTGFIAALLCILIILLGSFFILRLAIVLITVAFEKAKENEEEERKERNRRRIGKGRSKTAFGRMKSLVRNRSSSMVEYRGPESKMERISRGMTSIRLWVSGNILQRRRFTFLVPLVIMANILIMMSDHFGQSEGMDELQHISNIVFSSLYSVELILRIMGTEVRIFWKDALNVFDVLVVTLSWLDIAIDAFHIPFVRSLRSLRALKLLQSLPSVYLWISVIAECLYNSMALMFLILMFVFVFACMGMQIFGGYFCNLNSETNTGFCDGRPRSNFDAFGSAMVTCFQILTGDNWNEVMYDGMRARGPEYSVYFIILYYLGNNVLVNILIGILLTARSTSATEETLALQSVTFSDAELEMSLRGIDQPDDGEANQRHTYYMKAHSIRDVMPIREVFPPATNDEEEDEDEDAAEVCDFDDEPFLPNHPLRVKVRRVCSSKYFSNTVAALIFLNCVCMGLEDPRAAPNVELMVALRAVDVGFTSLFVIEWFLMSVSFGFGFGKHSYMGRSRWNLFDSVLVLLSVFGTLVAYYRISNTIRLIATFTALRPLRFVKRSKSLKVVVDSLLRSLIPVKNILIVATLLFTMWGIMGVTLFKGRFYRCTDESILTKMNCTFSGHRWVNAPLHFDHIFAAYASLFVMTSLDGWPSLMYNGIDAVSQDVAPIRNYHPAASVYFVLFVILSGFFIVNLFTSVLIDTYEIERRQNGGLTYMTPQQNAWMEAQLFLLRAIPDLPPSRATGKRAYQRWVWDIVTAPMFDHFINLCIVINMLVLAMDHYPSTAATSNSLELINYFFIAVFVVEVVLKLIAFRMKYFLSRWNCWDFFICLLSVLGAVGEELFNLRTVASAFRAVRVLRLLRAIRSLESIRKIMNSFLLSLVPLWNVTAVTFLIFFIFAIWGMALFGRVKRNGVLNEHSNFESISIATLTLFKAATGDNAPGIIQAYNIEPPECLERIGECGDPIISQIFFNVFVLLGMFILLNLFTAVIVESFHAMDVDKFMAFSRDHAGSFIRQWELFDRTWTMKIPTRDLIPFLNSVPLSNPLSLRFHIFALFLPPSEQYGQLRFLKAIDLRESDEGEIYLRDLIAALCEAAYSSSVPSRVRGRLQRTLEKKLGDDIGVPREQPAYRRIAVQKIWNCWLLHRNRFRYRIAIGEVPQASRENEIQLLKDEGLYDML